MKIPLTFIFGICLFQVTFSQSNDKTKLLTGTAWQITSLWEKEASEKDYKKIDEDYTCLYDGQLKFESNQVFTLTHTKKQCLDGNEKGKWKFNPDKTKLIVEAGETITYTLELLTSEKMILIDEQNVEGDRVLSGSF